MRPMRGSCAGNGIGGIVRAMRTPCIALLLAIVAPLCAMPARAAQYPERPIHLIVPFQAGSVSDNTARILATKLTELLGQQVIVEDRVGGSTIIGSEAVVHAAPDGYTIEMANTSSHATIAAVSPKLPFDPVTDFTPVGMIGSSPLVLVSANKLAARSVGELVALARRTPGGLSFASAGVGTIAHLAGELLQKQAGIQLTHVPYRGTSQSVYDVMEGRIDLLVGTLSGVEPHILAGKVRALAVLSEHRIDHLPDVPTIAEAGVPGAEVDFWSALVMPAGAKPDIVAKLNGALRTALQSPNIAEALRRQGVDPQPSSPEVAAATIKADVAKWNDVIKKANLLPKT